MMILLRTVTRSGTGAAAAQLNHPVGGKTGTTSDYTDAWFLGFRHLRSVDRLRQPSIAG